MKVKPTLSVLALLFSFSSLLICSASLAGICDKDNGKIPDCQEQQYGPPLHFRGWQTYGWAFYCNGDHPYVWDYSKDNNCFSTSDFGNADGLGKLDLVMTNWCFKKEAVTITLACSTKPDIYNPTHQTDLIPLEQQ